VTVDPPYGAGSDPDTSIGSPGAPVVVNPLTNDVPSHGATWVASSVCLVPDSAKKVTGLATAPCPKSASVAGMGSWSVNPDGTITFVPEPGFTGTAVIGYTVTDTNGVMVANTAAITIKALPSTGGPGLAAGLLGLVLVGVGGIVLVLARRRRRVEA
jgi:LPXTG-motif cell wall-anchored protein